MKLKYDAISYVLKSGNTHDKFKMFLVLGRKNEWKQLIEEFRLLQNADGGWPYHLERDNPSGIAITARTLVVLLKAGENKDSNTVQDAIIFLLKRQRRDGGWSENPELDAVIPKEWSWISTRHSCTYITADVMKALIETDYSKDPRVINATDFLRKTQNEEGGWPSHVGSDYTYGTDIAAMDHILEAFLSLGEPKESSIFKNALKALLKNRKDWKDPVGVSAALCILLMFGYPLGHEYVEELVINLVETQRPDGGWNWYGDLPSNPRQTVFCIEQLMKCGVNIPC